MSSYHGFPVFMYIYSCRYPLEVYKYLSVGLELMFVLVVGGNYDQTKNLKKVL